MELEVYADGALVKIKLEKVKEYEHFTLYQIYKEKKGEWVPLYKVTYTDDQLAKLVERKRLYACGDL